MALNWVRAEGAESCLSGSELALALRRVLAADSVTVAPLVIEGVVSRDPASGLFRARLRVLDAAGNTVGLRELTSAEPRCEQLTQSLVLVLSVLVELGSTAAPEPRSATVGVDNEPVPALRQRPPAEPVATAQPATDARAWQVEPLAALALSIGLNPDASLGPSLGLRVRTPWGPVWPALMLRAGYWPSGRMDTLGEAARPASVEFHSFATELMLCLAIVRTQPWWFAGCWGAALVLRKTRVRGLADANDSLRTAPGASTGLQVAYALSEHWQMTLDASLLGFLKRDQYTYIDTRGQTQTLFQPGPFVGLFTLGVGVRL